MKFGIREICDVVFKKKAPGFLGNLYLQAGMPAFYFDTLKTSTLEGQVTTVYAQGGRGNPRLISWDGDRVVTFTMEDALISPESFSILSGAGLIDAGAGEEAIYVHTTEQVQAIASGEDFAIKLEHVPANDGASEMYLMILDANGSIDYHYLPIKVAQEKLTEGSKEITGIKALVNSVITKHNEDHATVNGFKEALIPEIAAGTAMFVDYYVKAETGVKQIDIEAGKFGGSYYMEASCLWRDQGTGEDYPAEFVIPNCRVQSNFTFTMAPSGDPSTFTFTMDAFPDYTKFDRTKKVIAALQIVEDKATFGQVAAGEKVNP